MIGGLIRRANTIENDLPKKFADSLSEIGYVFEDKLGKGSYGSVYRCHLEDGNGVMIGDEMAVKHIDLSKEYKTKYREPRSIAELELIEEKVRIKEQMINTSMWRRFKARFGLGSRKHCKIEVTPESRLYLTQEQIENELNAFFRTNHSNVVRMHNQMTYNDSRIGSRNPNPIHTLIFLELAKGDLFTYIFRDQKTVTEDEAKYLSAQIIRGLSHLHSQGIAHLDLKPENVLVFYDQNNPNDVTMKITDFGFALLYPFDRSEESSDPKPFRCGSNCYADPLLIRTKYLRCQKPDTDVSDIDFYKADVWSYGCIVLLFFIGIGSFYDMFEANLRFLRFNPNFNLGNIYLRELRSKNPSQDLVSFLSDILCCDQTNRKSSFECGKHVWIKNQLIGLKRRIPSQRQLLETAL